MNVNKPVVVAILLAGLVITVSACQSGSATMPPAEAMPTAPGADTGGAAAAPTAAGVAAGAADPSATAAAGGMTAVPATPGDTAAASFTAPLTASLHFTSPANGSQVTSPVTVCLEATGITIEPSGEVRMNAGHHHIVVDPQPEDLQALTGGHAAMPKDERHIHLGTGAACTAVALSPGQHMLLGVVADGAHVPLSPPVISQLALTVK